MIARAFQRRDRRHDRMPGILANQDRRRSEQRGKVASRRPRERKRFVEHPYVGKNILRCTCAIAHRRRRSSRTARRCDTFRRRSRKAAHDVHRAGGAGFEPRAQPGREFGSRQRQFVHRAFEKISRHRSFGQHDQIGRPFRDESGEHVAQPPEVAREIALARLDLQNRNVDHGTLANARWRAGGRRESCRRSPRPDR